MPWLVNGSVEDFTKGEFYCSNLLVKSYSKFNLAIFFISHHFLDLLITGIGVNF